MTNEMTLAEKLYDDFFRRYPDLKNPTDLNTREKFEFAVKVGWENYCLMQRARKQGKEFADGS